jgi:hypothetical protein
MWVALTVAILIARDATWGVVAAPAPAPSRRIGAVALGGLDVAAGRAARGLAITGDDEAAAPPAGWPLVTLAEAAAAPVAPAPDQGERIAALWTTARFAIAPAQRDLRVLDLKVRYRDGLVVWINGVEVARRRIGAAARPTAFAGQPRGPEWETFHVPVVPGLLRMGDNLIAVETRPSGKTAAPRLELELLGRPAAALVRGPVLQAVTERSAVVVVETDLPAEAAVEWGPTAALGHAVASPAGRARRHEIALDGLPRSAPVFYRVLAAGAATPVREFRTVPGRGEVVRIALYGDVRGGHRTHARLVERIRDEDPDLVLSTGDLVARGSDEGDWQRFFAVTGELLATVPFWSTCGNHDVGRAGDGRRRFGDLFVLPPAEGSPAWATWYSFDVGDVHVAMLDSNAYDEPAQLAWLDADLAAARAAGARAILAVTHDGPFSRGSHGGNKLAASRYAPVLARHRVTLTLSGHDHIYQRGEVDGLDYIVSGGGGAPLYAISCGVDGKPDCKVDDGMLAAASEHHYVMLAVYPDFVEACPKRVDGSALEPCVRYRL